MPAVTIENTFGALEIGSSLAVFLFGIVTLQCHLYYTRFQEDKWALKLLVAAVWLLELGHTIGVSYEVYRATITFYGRPDMVVKIPVFGVVTIFGGLITMLVQNFFAYRAWRFLPHPYRFIAVACGAISIARAIMSTYSGIKGIMMDTLKEYQAEFQTFLTTLLVMGVVIDLIVAVSMLYFLFRRRDKKFNRASRLIDRLIAYTIRTGVMTCVSAITVLILFQTLSNTLVYLAMYTFLAKLYSNSLLSALNSRFTLREESARSVSMDLPRAIGGRAKSSMKRQHDPHNQAISIEMMTTTEFRSEDPSFYAVPYTPSSEHNKPDPASINSSPHFIAISEKA